MNTVAISADGLTPEVIDSVRTNLDKILASKVFLGSERLRRFLRFIVEEKLAGRSEQTKEYAVALEVFDKDGSFDPRTDPIVRVEAGRLRSKLREYYDVDGQTDPIRIELPKGSYVPVFHIQNGRAVREETGAESQLPHLMSPAPLQIDDRSKLSDTGLKSRKEQEPRRRDWYSWATVAVGVLLLATGFSYWMSQRGTLETGDRPMVVPFTTYSGSERDPSFSPDGKQIAFVWDGAKRDNVDIYIKQIGSDYPRRLTTHPNVDLSPVWSPDGQSIAFVREFAPGKSAVMIIAVNGGRERQVAGLRTQKLPSNSRMLSWHPGGRWLAVPSDQEAVDALASALYLLSPETGERRQLTFPTRGRARRGGDSNPAFSPEGRSLVFARFSGSGASEIFLLRITDGLEPDGEPKQLTFANRLSVTPAWLPDGKGVVYASGSHIHSARLWQLSIFGSSKPKPVSLSGQGPVVDPAISGVTRRLVYGSVSSDFNIWRNLILRSDEKSAPPSRLIASSMVQEGAQYSPDGKSVSFISYASGNGEIWVCDSNGLNAFQLTHLDGPLPSFPRWSPNGGDITFSLSSNGNRELYAVNSQGGQLRQLTRTSFDESNPSYSHDAQWIYFDSNRTGGSQVWKMPAAGGPAVQITRKGGNKPQESMDGKVLFYLQLKGSEFDELWEIPAEGGAETRVIERVLRTNFEVKQHGIYYAARPAGKETQFFFLDFVSGKTTRMATVQDDVEWGFSVSPDEKSILSTQNRGAEGSDLVLVENFQ